MVLTSVLFSAAHYIGPSGEVFRWYTFLFRFLAGTMFAVLFRYRGFGIAAGTHAVLRRARWPVIDGQRVSSWSQPVGWDKMRMLRRPTRIGPKARVWWAVDSLRLLAPPAVCRDCQRVKVLLAWRQARAIPVVADLSRANEKTSFCRQENSLGRLRGDRYNVSVWHVRFRSARELPARRPQALRSSRWQFSKAWFRFQPGSEGNVIAKELGSADCSA